jgi:hypothetical protein
LNPRANEIASESVHAPMITPAPPANQIEHGFIVIIRLYIWRIEVNQI